MAEIERIQVGDLLFNIYIAPYQIANKDPDIILEHCRKIQKNTGVITQVIDIGHIAGKEHVLQGIINAILSMENKENLAKHLNLEIMLYLTAQRQIQKAITLVGISKETKYAILILYSADRDKIGIARKEAEKILGEPDENIWNKDEELRKNNIIRHFEIKQEEIEIIIQKNENMNILDALQEAIMGRIALTKFKTG